MNGGTWLARKVRKIILKRMSKSIYLVVSFIMILSTGSAVGAEVIAGKQCPSKGAEMTVDKKKYTCIKSGKKLIWNKGTLIKTSGSTTSPTPNATPTIKEGSTPTPTPTKVSVPVKTFNLIPTISMTTYSERLRRYKDRPNGSLYIEQTRGTVQILLTEIPNFNSASEYFVVIRGGFVANNECKSGELSLPMDLRVGRFERAKNEGSLLGSLLPRSPKGFPIGIVFKVTAFPISFDCIYTSNLTKHSVSVIETTDLGTKITSQSIPFEFTTPVMWQPLPPKPTPTPNQIETFSITPDANCLPEGATVNSVDGRTYTCKKSSIDGLLRWTS
jgi:hypothetical protein